jgi:hypothetical protein
MDGQFLARLLADMVKDKCVLTPDMMEEDKHGRSVVSAWLFHSASGWRSFDLVRLHLQPPF